MWTADHWKDYEILDTSGGEKLERWGKYLLVRPDPQVIWNTEKIIPAGKRRTAIITGAAAGEGMGIFSSARAMVYSLRRADFSAEAFQF